MKNYRFYLPLFILAGTQLSGLSASGMSLDEYLLQVKRKNRMLTSADLSLEASRAKKDSGDLSLSPVLTAGYSVVSDKSLPSSVADRRQMNELSLGLSQKYSTGTALSLSAKTDDFVNDQPTSPAMDKYSTGTLGVTVQQSLWKDFFGAGTQLRRDRENAVNRFESVSIDLKKRGILVEAEAAFWDYIVAVEDLKLKKENLDRARKIESWTVNRLNNGISDRSDLMNAKALTSVRELEMASAQDELKAEELRLRQNLDLESAEPTPEIKANLVEPRPYMTDLAQKKNVIKIESYLTTLEAESKKLISSEVLDGLKPDLSLIGSYNTNSYNRDASTMQSHLTDTDRPKTFVGVNFTWMFDTDAKKAQVAAAQKDAMASQLAAEKNRLNGQEAWFEQLRKYEVTKENVKTLEKIAQFQRERAKAEQDKFAKGRTVTANVVTAETDSAEAEVKYLKAKSGLRKMEASALLFISTQE